MSNQGETFAVIMAGGVGTRFWPMSRTSKPKQFLDILGTGQSLIKMTFDRLTASVPPENILVVTNESYRSDVEQHLPELPAENILGEPCMRNTAPCIAYANSVITSRASDPSNTSIIVAPSDHLITNKGEFNRVLNQAFNLAVKSSSIVTIGITPSRPDTGYGYIKHSNSDVIEFTEKPDAETAKGFLKSGDYCWNSGIFVWSLETINEAFSTHLPQMFEAFKALDNIEAVYDAAENISIDYGVLEKASNVKVIPAEFGWSDLGTWTSLANHLENDTEGNGVVSAELVATDSKGNIVVAPEGKVVAIKGMDNFIVVDTKDALLICPKTDEQWVKKLVGNLTSDHI